MDPWLAGTIKSAAPVADGWTEVRAPVAVTGAILKVAYVLPWEPPVRSKVAYRADVHRPAWDTRLDDARTWISASPRWHLQPAVAPSARAGTFSPGLEHA